MHERLNPHLEESKEWRLQTLEAENSKLNERIESLEAENERLFELAYKDKLTGLWNRNGLQMLLEKRAKQHAPEHEENRRAKRKDSDISLLILDIDHFKSVNDELGHNAGDEVLAAVGKELKERLRDTDIVARWGGEELVVVFEGHDERGVLDRFSAQSEKEKVEGIIGRPRFNVDVDVEGRHLKITLSGGVTNFDPKSESYEEAFKRADEALYKAKGKNDPSGQGRDRIVGSDEQKERDQISLNI
jgi:diguanylate cyclase (GGDEF)-like protein